MVMQHYRWDFIGLSSYDKPTPETSEKVVDGSTYYEANTSKLYVFYKDTWYEKTATGGGGEGGSAVKTLTSADFNWNLTLNSATEPYDCVALWLLDDGIYNKKVSSGLPVAIHANPYGIETLGMGTFIVSTISLTSKLITYATTNNNHWTQQIVNITDGVSQGTEKILTGRNVVQITGTSTTDVMSQNATTSMVFADPTTKQKIQIGDNATATGGSSVAIGNTAKAEAVSATAVGRNSDVKHQSGTAIGYYTKTNGEGSVAMGADAVAGSSVYTQGATAIGMNASASAKGSTAIGAYSYSTTQGEMNIGTSQTAYGYNNTNYRLISGVHSPVNDHDATTKGYVDSFIANSMIIKPITNFDYNFDSTDPTNTDPDTEDCNSWALWKFPSMGVSFLSYENGLGSDIYISGGSNPQTIVDSMGAEAGKAGFIVVGEINGVVNTTIYSVSGQIGPFQIDPSTGEPV